LQNTVSTYVRRWRGHASPAPLSPSRKGLPVWIKRQGRQGIARASRFGCWSHPFGPELWLFSNQYARAKGRYSKQPPSRGSATKEGGIVDIEAACSASVKARCSSSLAALGQHGRPFPLRSIFPPPDD